MKLFVTVLAGTDAWDAQPIFASADPDIVGAVVGKLNDRLTGPLALRAQPDGAALPTPDEATRQRPESSDIES